MSGFALALHHVLLSHHQTLHSPGPYLTEHDCTLPHLPICFVQYTDNDDFRPTSLVSPRRSRNAPWRITRPPDSLGYLIKVMGRARASVTSVRALSTQRGSKVRLRKSRFARASSRSQPLTDFSRLAVHSHFILDIKDVSPFPWSLCWHPCSSSNPCSPDPTDRTGSKSLYTRQ